MQVGLGIGCSEILAIAWVAKVWEADTHTSTSHIWWYTALKGVEWIILLRSGKKWGKVGGSVIEIENELEEKRINNPIIDNAIYRIREEILREIEWN